VIDGGRPGRVRGRERAGAAGLGGRDRARRSRSVLGAAPRRRAGAPGISSRATWMITPCRRDQGCWTSAIAILREPGPDQDHPHLRSRRHSAAVIWLLSKAHARCLQPEQRPLLPRLRAVRAGHRAARVRGQHRAGDHAPGITPRSRRRSATSARETDPRLADLITPPAGQGSRAAPEGRQGGSTSILVPLIAIPHQRRLDPDGSQRAPFRDWMSLHTATPRSPQWQHSHCFPRHRRERMWTHRRSACVATGHAGAAAERRRVDHQRVHRVRVSTSMTCSCTKACSSVLVGALHRGRVDLLRGRGMRKLRLGAGRHWWSVHVGPADAVGQPGGADHGADAG